MKTKLLLASVTLILAACGKPFPVSQDLYDEYQGIVCKISTGGLTPQDIVRQTQLNAIFQQKLTEGGQPSADWVATHAKKLGEVMDVKNCGKLAANAGSGSAPTAAADPALTKFEGIWIFSADKSKAVNTEGDDMSKARAQVAILAMEMGQANSAGLKIEGGRLQDGDTRCSIEGGADAKGLFNCVDPANRSVTSKLTVDAKGDLILSDAGTNPLTLVFEKKK